MAAFSRFPLVDFLAAVAALILILRFKKFGYDGVVRLVWLIFVGLVLVQAILMVIQYQYWQIDPLMQLVLPPHASITYFLHYGYFAFLRPIIWRLVGAIIVLVTMLMAHGLFRRSLFWPDEFRLVPTLSLLPAFPFGLLLLPFGLAIGLVARFSQGQTWHEKQPLKSFWLPATFVLVLIALSLSQTAWFYRLQP